ncbi:hypothetical protein COLO4_16500 [Corchorus olitorius]|uniref:Uncharacterized protein n=1 Tax=Corchorus olitorius TaxID=93759 RepID=A0A1R3JH95_9ROSI|nr:hypothetical protein COLO4_16500 [Corchorus olitorius]
MSMLQSDRLEAVRLLVDSTEEVDKEIDNYVMGGKVVELAFLILAAPEKITKPIPFGGSDGSMTIRQYLLGEISLLKATQTSVAYCPNLYKTDEIDEADILDYCDSSLRKLKHKLALSMSQLFLLEVCEWVGNKIVTYLKEHQLGQYNRADNFEDEQEVAKDIVSLLQNAGAGGWIGTCMFTRFMEKVDCQMIICPSTERFYEKLVTFLTDTLPYYLKLEKTSRPLDLMDDTLEHLPQSATSFITDLINIDLQNKKDINFDDDQLNSLAAALENLSRHQYFEDWRPEKSIFKLVYILCFPELNKLLENIRSHAYKVEDVKPITCQYAKDGKLVELAALLMVAREKLITRSPYDDLESMAIRQCFIREIRSIIDQETKFIGKDENSIRMCKYRKRVMSHALVLLDVFEIAGVHIDWLKLNLTCRR